MTTEHKPSKPSADERVQVVELTLRSGRVVRFSGPVQVSEADGAVRGIRFLGPFDCPGTWVEETMTPAKEDK